VTQEDLATAMGVSLQAIRQARANEGTTAYRAPPEGWERAVSKLAEGAARRHLDLARKLRAVD
jgi:hypothetical protein